MNKLSYLGHQPRIHMIPLTISLTPALCRVVICQAQAELEKCSRSQGLASLILWQAIIALESQHV